MAFAPHNFVYWNSEELKVVLSETERGILQCLCFQSEIPRCHENAPPRNLGAPLVGSLGGHKARPYDRAAAIFMQSGEPEGS